MHAVNIISSATVICWTVLTTHGIDNPLIANNLRSVTLESLAKWYIDNYIRQCAADFPEISQLFDNTSTNAVIVCYLAFLL